MNDEDREIDASACARPNWGSSCEPGGENTISRKVKQG